MSGTTSDADEPRWLSGEERRAWLALVGMLARLSGALDAQLRRDAGISHFDYTVLAALSEAPDRTLRMSTLAALAEGSLPRLSQVVARLEAKGWVRRTPDPADGRYTLAGLTDDGAVKVVATAPGHVEEVRRLVFDPLTKAQVHQLTAIGHRIVRAIDPGDPCLADRPSPPPDQDVQRSGKTTERAGDPAPVETVVEVDGAPSPGPADAGA